MVQTKLFSEKDLPSQIINVASVPQLSPFRYPGGKTWFVPQFRNWIFSHEYQPDILLEPFAGGGIISLTAIHENLAGKAVMVEKDPDVAAVWHTILSDDATWLTQKILNFDLTLENVRKVIEKKSSTTKEKAFQTILKNRTFHGGILAHGSGLLKNGEKGKGVKSRWYPETLAKRISTIQKFRERISFIEGDAFDEIPKYLHDPRCSIFIDPPYTAGGKRAGKRLYNYHKLDHTRLFELCTSATGLFLMTYDNTQEIKEMASKKDFLYKEIPMKNTHHAKMTELIVGKKTDPLFLVNQDIL